MFERSFVIYFPKSFPIGWLNKVSCIVRINTFLICALILSVQICAQGPTVEEVDLIHFGDVIDVDVVGSLEFDWRGKLNPEGYLDGLNTYGEPVYGLCRSESEIADSAAAAISKTLREPKVIVRIIDRSNRAVATLDGAVRSPQRFQLRRAVRLQELLILAGGVTDDAGGEIQIFRPPHLNCFERHDPRVPGTAAATPANDPAVPLLVIKIQDLLRASNDANLLIRSGDLITVLPALPVYVIGEVNDPRRIVSRPGLTLSAAVAMAGGLAKDGSASRITIYRRQGGLSTVIEADLLKIEAKVADDPLILPTDIVEVAQKNKAARKFAPVVEPSRAARPAVLPLRIVD
jgi:protein involved in polysaccharide export with SLBB domain